MSSQAKVFDWIRFDEDEEQWSCDVCGETADNYEEISHPDCIVGVAFVLTQQRDQAREDVAMLASFVLSGERFGEGELEALRERNRVA